MKGNFFIYLGLICFLVFFFLTIKRITEIGDRQKELDKFKKSEVKGIINFIDEGRGIIIGLQHSKLKYRISGNLIKTNSASFNYPYFRFGDSIFKKNNSDTFIITRKNEIFVYLIPK
jgi:hypothetical protein